MKRAVMGLAVAACLAFSVHVLWGQEGAVPAPADAPTPLAEEAEVAAPAAEPAAEVPVAAPEAPAPAAAGEQLVSMTMSDAKLTDVLRTLAQMRPGVNIIMEPDVQAQVSFALREVKWETALQLITESNGFQAVREAENIYRVRRVQAPQKVELTLVVLTPEEAAALAEPAVDRYLANQPEMDGKSAAERREWLAARAGLFVKQLDAENRPAAEIVEHLAKAGGFNFTFQSAAAASAAAPAGRGAPSPAAAAAAGPAVLSPVTVHLKEVAIVDAMRLVAGQGGLSCNLQNGVWVVAPRMVGVQEPLILETFTVSFVPVDDNLVNLCKALLSPAGQVRAGRNKILIVKDTPDGVEAVRRTLAAMDRPTPQVLIEARFYELTESASKDLGVNWNTLWQDGATIEMKDLMYSHEWTAVTGSDDITKNMRSAILDVGTFSVVLRALEQDNGARQLSNPKVLVASDEQATIHIGAQTPIIKSSLETSDTGTIISYELDGAFGGEQVQDEQLLERPKGQAQSASRYTVRKGYLDLGTRLAVAPSVKTDKEVYIKVVPELTSVVRWIELKSGEATISYPELYATRVRTEFTIQSGQTIAIGGLVSEKESSGKQKIPVLGSIPLAGRLFSYKTESKSQAETIIFLTVRIVPSGELATDSGVPTRARLIRPEFENIRSEDSRSVPVTTPETQTP
jgi:type II secretory pathway component GspD/PulD (secretin)